MFKFIGEIGDTFIMVVEWVIGAFRWTVVQLLVLTLLVGVGALLGLGGDYLDDALLGWRWPAEHWRNLGIGVAIGWYVLNALAPSLWETLIVLVRAGAVIAGLALLAAWLTERPWLPIAMHIGVIFCPFVFFIWVLRIIAANVGRRRGEETTMTAEFFALLQTLRHALLEAWQDIPWRGELAAGFMLLCLVAVFISTWLTLHEKPAPPPPPKTVPDIYGTRVDDAGIKRLEQEGLL